MNKEIQRNSKKNEYGQEKLNHIEKEENSSVTTELIVNIE